MYLKMLKGKDVVIRTNNEEELYYKFKNLISYEEESGFDILNTKLFKLAEMAKLLGANRVFLKRNKNEIMCNEPVIEYMGLEQDEDSKFICQNAELVIRVFWDELNNALAIEEIWHKGIKVGWMEYNKDKSSAKPMGALLEIDYGFIDVRYENYDFTRDTDVQVLYGVTDLGNIYKVNKPKYPYGKFSCGKTK